MQEQHKEAVAAAEASNDAVAAAMVNIAVLQDTALSDLRCSMPRQQLPKQLRCMGARQ